MKALAQQHTLPLATLALLKVPSLDGVVSPSHPNSLLKLEDVVSQSYYSDARIEGRGLIYTERTTVWMDDKAIGKRVVVHLAIETKKKAKKHTPIKDSIPRVQITLLEGFDAVKDIWGSKGSTESHPDIAVGDAWEIHQQFESIRDGMRKDNSSFWYPA